MTLSKAWNPKLEAASFLLSKILYKQCESHSTHKSYCELKIFSFLRFLPPISIRFHPGSIVELVLLKKMVSEASFNSLSQKL